MAAIVNSVRLSRHHIWPIGEVLSTQCCRDYSSAVDLVDAKRGRGGRSSFSGNVVTVFGASGFLGRYITARLGREGSQAIIPHRGDVYHVFRLKVCGDLGQILFHPYHLQDDDSIRKAMKYSNVVVNLVGRDFETKNFKYKDVHVDGARRIAKLAKECGVKRLIHLSALNATETPQEIYIKGGSNFYKTKKLGEDAVMNEFPDATIFRPADMFGAEDRFLRYYADWWRKTGDRTIQLWKKGEMTVKQPVFVANVAEGIMNAIHDPETVGKIYECVGPHRYYLCDLVSYLAQILRIRNYRIGRIGPFFMAKVKFMSYAPNTPVFTIDRIEREHVTDSTTGELTLEDLGVNLEGIENRAMFELRPFRSNAYYDEKLGEFADPPFPEKAPIIHH